jgi:hypothetical protein
VSAQPEAYGPCVEATGSLHKGYGVGYVTVGGRRAEYRVRASRLVFEQAWGVRLEPGQVVRHTCDNARCVNPLHLMVGTQLDNVRDRDRRGRQWNARKTHCAQGHEFTEANTYRPTPGKRQCRTCNRERQSRRARA